MDDRTKDAGHHNEKFSDLVLRGDGLRKASVGRDAVFTVNYKQLLVERISLRIVDPRGAVVPHREAEIQDEARISSSDLEEPALMIF